MKTYIVMYEKETLDQAKALFEAETPAKSDKLYLVGAKETSISMADARILFELPIKPVFINPAESILTYTIGYLIGANKTDNITLIINKEYADLQAFIKETGMDINIIVPKAARKVKKEPIQTPASKAETAHTKDTSAKNMETTSVTQPKPRKRAVKVTADTFDELIKKLEKQSNMKLKEYTEKIRTVVSDASDPEIGLPMLLRLHAIPENVHDIVKTNFAELKRLS